jgi:hypothetical protein
MKLTIQYSGPFNPVTLPESGSAGLIHQACTLAEISLASTDMRRAMFLKGLPALHAEVKALRHLTPGDQESIDPWHFGFPEDGTEELDDALRECDEAMQNGDDLTNIVRRLLEALCKTDDYIREWLVIVLSDANEVTAGDSGGDLRSAVIDQGTTPDAAQTPSPERREITETKQDINKSTIMAALAVAGITSLVVNFDGNSDNGQIESIEARAGETKVELPAALVQIVDSDDKESIKSANEMPLAEAIERLCFDYLSDVYTGWEINEGSHGDFAFTVADNSVELDFYKRFEDEENSSYEF